jgi:AmiR/NasT family two-component response regulator
MLGLRRSEYTMQVDREVDRAQVLLTELYGLGVGEASVALRDEAVATGVSMHAAALAVVANWATQAPVLRRSPRGL